jgi:glycerol-3-phosphate acyltransferase PlsY
MITREKSAYKLTVNFIMADNKIYFRNMFSRCFCGAAKIVVSNLLFWKHSGNIQRTFREHSGNIQGTFREHSGNIQGTFRVRSMNI